MRERWDTQEIRDRVSIASALSMLDAPVGSRGRTACPIPGCSSTKKNRPDEFSYTAFAWKCFRCGGGGDVIELVRRVTGCGFLDALEWFSGRGISIKKGPIKPRLSLRSFWVARRSSAEEQRSSISRTILHHQNVELRKIKALHKDGQLDDLDAAMLSDMARETAERRWYYLDLEMFRMSDLYRKELKRA